MSKTRNATNSSIQPQVGGRNIVIQYPTNSSNTMPPWSHAEPGGHLVAEPGAERERGDHGDRVQPGRQRGQYQVEGNGHQRAERPWCVAREAAAEPEREAVPPVAEHTGLMAGSNTSVDPQPPARVGRPREPSAASGQEPGEIRVLDRAHHAGLK